MGQFFFGEALPVLGMSFVLALAWGCGSKQVEPVRGCSHSSEPYFEVGHVGEREMTVPCLKGKDLPNNAIDDDCDGKIDDHDAPVVVFSVNADAELRVGGNVNALPAGQALVIPMSYGGNTVVAGRKEACDEESSGRIVFSYNHKGVVRGPFIVELTCEFADIFFAAYIEAIEDC